MHTRLDVSQDEGESYLPLDLPFASKVRIV